MTLAQLEAANGKLSVRNGMPRGQLQQIGAPLVQTQKHGANIKSPSDPSSDLLVSSPRSHQKPHINSGLNVASPRQVSMIFFSKDNQRDNSAEKMAFGSSTKFRQTPTNKSQSTARANLPGNRKRVLKIHQIEPS